MTAIVRIYNVNTAGLPEHSRAYRRPTSDPSSGLRATWAHGGCAPPDQISGCKEGEVAQPNCLRNDIEERHLENGAQSFARRCIGGRELVRAFVLGSVVARRGGHSIAPHPKDTWRLQ